MIVSWRRKWISSSTGFLTQIIIYSSYSCLKIIFLGIEFWVVIFFEHTKDILLSSDLICQSKAATCDCFLNYFSWFLFLKFCYDISKNGYLLFILPWIWVLVSSLVQENPEPLFLHLLFPLYPLFSFFLGFKKKCQNVSLYALCLLPSPVFFIIFSLWVVLRISFHLQITKSLQLYLICH